MPIWHSGQAWRVVNSLNKLNEQIRAYAPRSVPPATPVESWGSIADAEHSASSDHYPHFYGALGATAVVCARDFPHAPGLGLDGGVVTEHMRRTRDARVQYIIFNRRITGVNYGWQWRTYTGDDPHDKHFHVSGVHTAAADGTQPWSLPISEDDMDASDPNFQALIWRMKALVDDSATVEGGPSKGTENKLHTRLAELQPAPIVIDDATRDALAAAAGEVVKEVLGAAFEARLTAWANSAEGRAAIVAAVNVAEDS